jgi:iron complex outermembrane receptor protein
VDNKQDNGSETYYTDYQWQHHFKHLDLRVTSGTTNELVLANSDLFQGRNYRQNHSLYTQLDKKWNKINLSFGTRFEHFMVGSEKTFIIDGDSINTYSRSKPVFRAGANYQVAEATYIRSSWGQGFRFPSMAEMFISTTYSGIELYANPELKPETGWSTEIGIKQGLKMGNWMGYLDAAAFLMEYNDMMEFNFGFWGETVSYNIDPITSEISYEGVGFKSVNVGETRVSGMEFSLTGHGDITKEIGVNLLAGYTYMNTKSLNPNEVYYESSYYLALDGLILDTIQQSLTYNNSSSDTTVLKYRYKHIAKLDAEITYKKFAIGSSFRYNDFMKNIDAIFVDPLMASTIPDINQAREKFTNGDFIIDIRTSYQLNDITKISLVVNNLLNREYMTRPATMMPPRTIALQCNMKI